MAQTLPKGSLRQIEKAMRSVRSAATYVRRLRLQTHTLEAAIVQINSRTNNVHFQVLDRYFSADTTLADRVEQTGRVCTNEPERCLQGERACHHLVQAASRILQGSHRAGEGTSQPCVESMVSNYLISSIFHASCEMHQWHSSVRQPRKADSTLGFYQSSKVP